MKQTVVITLLLFFSSGCIVAGGYSSGRGWFIWPGTIGILLFLRSYFFFSDDAKSAVSLILAPNYSAPKLQKHH